MLNLRGLTDCGPLGGRTTSSNHHIDLLPAYSKQTSKQTAKPFIYVLIYSACSEIKQANGGVFTR